MSARSKVLRRRERDGKRRNSGFDITSIRSGHGPVIEHLAEPIPAEVFETTYDRPTMAIPVRPGFAVYVTARRRLHGFPRHFRAGFYMRPNPPGGGAYFVGLQSHGPVGPGEDVTVHWQPTMAGLFDDFVVPVERLRDSSRRKLPARGRRKPKKPLYLHPGPFASIADFPIPSSPLFTTKPDP